MGVSLSLEYSGHVMISHSLYNHDRLIKPSMYYTKTINECEHFSWVGASVASMLLVHLI
mgnify:FL=1